MTITTRAVLSTLAAAPVLFGAMLFSTPSVAQAPAGQASSSAGPNLDAAQRSKADALQAQFKRDLETLRADPKLTDAQKQAKFNTLYQAMDANMMGILTPAQRSQVQKQRQTNSQLVQKQRQINSQLQADVAALRANKTMTPSQKQAHYVQLVQNARNASVALLPADQRAAALKRIAAADQAQRVQLANIAEAKKLGQQLQKSESPAQSQKLNAIALSTKNSMQAVIADKSLSDADKTTKINAYRQDALSRDLVLLTPAQRTLYSRIQALVSAPPAH